MRSHWPELVAFGLGIAITMLVLVATFVAIPS